MKRSFWAATVFAVACGALPAACDVVIGIGALPAREGEQDAGLDATREAAALIGDEGPEAAVDSGAPDASIDGPEASGPVLDSGDAAGPFLNPHRVVQISAGFAETVCAVTVDGLVYCWGANGEGEVGDGTRIQRNQAVQVAKDSTGAPFGNIVEVTVGALHACARDQYRNFYCWGDDDIGQLGDLRCNTDGGIYDGGLQGIGAVVSTTPVKQTLRGQGPLQIVAGLFHTCYVDHDPATDSGAGVVCWGGNVAGELGHDPGTNGDVTANLGDIPFTANPYPLSALLIPPDISGVSLGTYMGCYVRSDRSLWCFGADDEGELGTLLGTSSTAPVEVPGPGNVGFLSEISEVSAHGQDHVCALAYGGVANLFCWGYDASGETGPNGPVGSGGSSQALVLPVSNATHVAAGADDSCAIIGTAGQIACWGSNSDNQIGHINLGDQTCSSTQTPCDPTPTLVSAAGDAGGAFIGAVQISLGMHFACALKADGTVWCWGAGAQGQLGNGGTSDSPVPVQVVGLP